MLVCHRRAGKTVATVNDLQRSVLTCPLPRPRVAYVAPFRSQAKDVAWQYVKEFAAPIPGVAFNESELRVDYPNGGQFRLYGADNYDAMRGLYFDDVGLDEFADYPSGAWATVIRPALSDRNGRATFIGTPKGKNEFYDVWSRASDDPAWFRMMLKASESGIISEEELKAARQDMGEDRFEQEYECSFEAAITGAYYGKEMKAAANDGRITGVPYERGSPVFTAWDLGIDDATAIWFAQQVGREVRVIDYYEASGADAAHYAEVLRERGYSYASHILPHDGGAREKGNGKTYADQLKEAGLKGDIRIMPRTADVLSDINRTRGFLSKCWFDAKRTAKGLEALRQYQREWDERMKTYRQRPRHDWTSHGADAFRALATGMRPVSAAAAPIIRKVGTLA